MHFFYKIKKGVKKCQYLIADSAAIEQRKVSSLLNARIAAKKMQWWKKKAQMRFWTLLKVYKRRII
jgi:hypothetical protein